MAQQYHFLRASRPAYAWWNTLVWGQSHRRESIAGRAYELAGLALRRQRFTPQDYHGAIEAYRDSRLAGKGLAAFIRSAGEAVAARSRREEALGGYREASNRRLLVSLVQISSRAMRAAQGPDLMGRWWCGISLQQWQAWASTTSHRATTQEIGRGYWYTEVAGTAMTQWQERAAHWRCAIPSPAASLNQPTPNSNPEP